MSLLLCIALPEQATALPGFLGEPIRVSTSSSFDDETGSVVAVDAVGGGIAAWVESGEIVRAQRFEPNGGLSGDRMSIGFGDRVDVDMDPAGGFVVAYGRKVGSVRTIAVQRFDAADVIAGGEQRVDQNNLAKSQSVVSLNANGRFVVAWLQGSGSDDSPAANAYVDVMARRYDAAGMPLGPEFVVDASPAAGFSADVDVGMTDDGRFVVTYERCAGLDATTGQATGCDVVFRRFNADGLAQGGEGVVNTTRAGEQGSPRIAVVPQGARAGSFKIVWAGRGLVRDGAGIDPQGVFERNYSATGTATDDAELPLSPARNEPADRFQAKPAVSTDRLGNSIVTWQSFPDAAMTRSVDGYFQLCRAPVTASDLPTCFGGFSGGQLTLDAPSAVDLDADGDPWVISDADQTISDLPPLFSFPQFGRGVPWVVMQPLTGVENVDLRVDAVPRPNPVLSGEVVEFSITIRNLHPGPTVTGQGVATQVATQVLTTGFIELESFSGSNWQCEQPPPTQAFSSVLPLCEFDGVLDPGAETTVTLQARIINNRSFSTDTLAAGRQFDSDFLSGTGNNRVTVEVPVTPVPIVMQFDQTLADLGENASTQDLRVRLSRRTPNAVSFKINLTGTATLGFGDDYSGPGSLFIPAGQSEVRATYNIRNDQLDERTEVIVATLDASPNSVSTNEGIVLGPRSTARIRITDDDAPPTISVTDADSSVREGSFSEFLVRLSEPSGQAVSVSFAPAGTATMGEDYLAPAQTLSFAPGVTTRLLRVRTIEDDVAEPSEVLRLRLSELRNATLGTPSVYRLVITDDD